MGTDFTVTIVHPDAQYARQAAAEAWLELDRLEGLLSRFVSFSDVARIGRCQARECVLIAADTYDCLQVALRLELETRGAFNIAFRHRPASSTAALLRLTDIPPTVVPTVGRVHLDLGGIGKGFALDRIAALFLDWDISRFLICASASTLLAGAPPPDTQGWPIRFGPGGHQRHLLLRQAAFSGSGTAVKGTHIVDPRTAEFATHYQMAWAGAPTAAEADALSTAHMVMDPRSIRRLLERRQDCLAYVLEAGQNMVTPFQRTSSHHVYRPSARPDSCP